MKYGPVEFTDKKGQCIKVRSAREEDALKLITYMHETAGETPFLIREPDEPVFPEDREREFLKEKEASEKELMLTAFEGDRLAGAASLSSLGTRRRYAHRCHLAVALYKEYWGAGIAERMLRIIIEEAKKAGYELMELEVVEGNDRAIALYEKLGFRRYGVFPDNMKYKDGSYRDAYWMMKDLR